MPSRNDPGARLWAEAFDLLEQADRLHRQFFRLTSSQRTAQWEPPVDVYEDERELVVIVAMPGVPAERVEVIAEPGSLLVRGVRPLPIAETGHRVRQLEIPYGAFERRITLPGHLEASPPEIVQGCLVVQLRKVGLR